MNKTQTKIDAERYVAPAAILRTITSRRVIASSDDIYGNLGQLNGNEEE